MEFILKLISRFKNRKRLKTNLKDVNTPLVLLPVTLRALYTLYHENISIYDAETVKLNTYHRDIREFLNGVETVIEALKGNDKIRQTYRIKGELHQVVIYDFCKADDKDNYINPNRLLPILCAALDELNLNLQHLEPGMAEWDYWNRAVKYIALDARNLAISAQTIKDNNG